MGYVCALYHALYHVVCNSCDDYSVFVLLHIAVVSFERAVYSVNEGDRTTEVCVVVTGGPRMENISVRVETTPVPCVDSGRSALMTFGPGNVTVSHNNKIVFMVTLDFYILQLQDRHFGTVKPLYSDTLRSSILWSTL